MRPANARLFWLEKRMLPAAGASWRPELSCVMPCVKEKGVRDSDLAQGLGFRSPHDGMANTLSMKRVWSLMKHSTAAVLTETRCRALSRLPKP